LFTFGEMPNNMNGKQVISKKSYNKDGVPMSLKEPIKGVFQRWGDEVLYEDERTFGRTIAIVLGEDGIVYTAPPSAVTLLNERYC